MDILKEITQVLFEKDTISKVKEQNKSFTEKVPIESQNISFRLFLTPAKNINLEIMMRDEYGYFFKPVGYYEFKEDCSLKNIYVLKEFEDTYKEIKHNISSDLSSIVKFLTLQENGYIAASSREVSNVVRRMFDSPQYSPYNHFNVLNRQVENIISNGLRVQVRTSIGGALEALVIDVEDTDGLDLFVIYQNNDGIGIQSSEDVYYKMLNKSLLTALK